MYLYFDKNGILKEIINDDALRAGNSDINKIWIYVEDSDVEHTTCLIRYMSPLSAEPTAETQVQLKKYNQQIPYDDKRDLKYFKYYTDYNFYVETIPDTVLDAVTENDNTVRAVVRLLNSGHYLQLGDILFTVSYYTNKVDKTEYLDIAQYNYLLSLLTPQHIHSSITLEELVELYGNVFVAQVDDKGSMSYVFNIYPNGPSGYYSIRMNMVAGDTLYMSDIVIGSTTIDTVMQSLHHFVVNDELDNYQLKLVSGINIKTINDSSVLGSGNLEVKTYKTFDLNWTTDGTIKGFCDDVNADSNAEEGNVYLGELTCSDLPFNGNADAVVEVIDGTGTSGKVIHIVLTSGNIAPYRWEYTYWNDGLNVSGWIPYQTQFVYTENISENTTLKTLYDTYGNFFIGKISASHINGYCVIQISSVGGSNVNFNFYDLTNGTRWSGSNISNTTTILQISNNELTYKTTNTPVYKHTISLGTSGPTVVLYSSSKTAITNDTPFSEETGTADKLVMGCYYKIGQSVIINYDSTLSTNGGKILAIKKYNGTASDLKSGTQLTFSTVGITGDWQVDIVLGTISDVVVEV